MATMVVVYPVTLGPFLFNSKPQIGLVALPRFGAKDLIGKKAFIDSYKYRCPTLRG